MKAMEYEFTLSDGSKRYEFVDPEADYSVITQVGLFMAMHKAVKAWPVKKEQPR
jgi:hypothetical protein